MASRRRRTSNGQNECCHGAGGDSTGRWRLDLLGPWRQAADALLDRALAQRLKLRVPSGVVGQVWRDGRIQVTLARFLQIDEVEVIPLDEQLARACGELCGATETADIIDASVVIVAKQRGDHVVTSDPRDLRRLNPTCPIIPI